MRAKRLTKILGLVGLVGLAGLAASSAASAQGPEPREPWSEPVELPTEAAIRELLCWAMDRTAYAWDRTQERAILRAATLELFGVELVDHVEGDHVTVTHAIELLREAFAALADEAAAGGDPCAPEASGGPLTTVPDSEPPPAPAPFTSVHGEPPPAPVPFASVQGVDDRIQDDRIQLEPVYVDPTTTGIVVTYPQGGRLYQVVRGDTLLGTGDRSIVYRWLASDAFLAAKGAGQTDGQARATARTIARNDRIRVAAYELLGCAPWNDSLYGTYQVSRQSYPLFATGRGFTMLPIHARNLDRIKRGEAPIRAVPLGRPGQQGEGAPTSADPARAFALLWLPALDGPALLAGRVELRPEPYGDGSSRIWPPPPIADLGHLSDLGPIRWGCQGHEVTV